jgi:hypothetical protein
MGCGAILILPPPLEELTLAATPMFGQNLAMNWAVGAWPALSTT